MVWISPSGPLGLQRFQMDLARGFQKRSRTSGPTVFKFVNSKGAVLDNDAKFLGCS